MKLVGAAAQPTFPSTPNTGIFCLEGDWDADLRCTTTVEPILELLQKLGVASYIHRNAAIPEQFDYYLGEWTKPMYDQYRVLYLSTHGIKNTVSLAPGEEVSLHEMTEILNGKAKGRVIHFAGCSTLDIGDEALMQFAKDTGASAITGYRSNVGWAEAAAFEVLMLTKLVSYKKTHAFFNNITAELGELANRLGLVVATSGRVYRAGVLVGA
jgi:hypothetical protein